MSGESLDALLFLTARIAAALFLLDLVWRRRALALAWVAAHVVHLGVIAAAFAGPMRERFLASWPLLFGAGSVVYALVLALGYRALARVPPTLFDAVAYAVVWAAFARPLVTRAITLRTPEHVAFAAAFLAAGAFVAGRAFRGTRLVADGIRV
jgi:hypothetical protein